MVEQPALGDSCRAGGGIHRRRSLALVDEDRLEGVEHVLAGEGRTAHVLDRIDGGGRILILYRLDGIETEDEMTHHELPARRAHCRRAARQRVGWRGWAALVVLMLPVLLVSVDNTVLSFALPQIALDLEPDERPAALDHRRLPARAREPARHDGHARRPLRQATDAADRRHRLRHRLGARRLRPERRVAHRRARAPWACSARC